MPYRFAIEKKDYSDFSSGQFFYSAPNQPAFPVRLSSEIFQRCKAYLQSNGHFPPYTIYDPCVGSAYHLVTTAFLHWADIEYIVGADIDANVSGIARNNFSLLTQEGVARRIEEITALVAQYQKESHRENLAIAQRFQKKLLVFLEGRGIETAVFENDALNVSIPVPELLESLQIDLVFSDVPYGEKSSWAGEHHNATNPIWRLLEQLSHLLDSNAIVTIATDKTQKADHNSYQRFEQFKMGKRKIMIYQRI